MNATVGFQDLRADNAVAYISPSFSGFTLAAAVVPAGGSTGIGSLNTESDQHQRGLLDCGYLQQRPLLRVRGL